MYRTVRCRWRVGTESHDYVRRVFLSRIVAREFARQGSLVGKASCPSCEGSKGSARDVDLRSCVCLGWEVARSMLFSLSKINWK